MLDINIEAQKALEKTGYNIAFHYPQSMDTIPVVSFYTVSEAGDMSADNCEMFRTGVVAVDVFCDVPSQSGVMAQQINQVMNEDGWSRISTMDIPEETDGLFHKSMKFTKSFFMLD